jgi:hypothetical protein
MVWFLDRTDFKAHAGTPGTFRIVKSCNLRWTRFERLCNYIGYLGAETSVLMKVRTEKHLICSRLASSHPSMTLRPPTPSPILEPGFILAVMGNTARIRTIDRLPIDTALQPQILSPRWNPFSATGIPVSEIGNYVLHEFQRPLSHNACCAGDKG